MAICKEIVSKNIENVKSNILVTGSNGQLGSEIKELVGSTASVVPGEAEATLSNAKFYFTTSKDLDITNHQQSFKF